VRSVVAGGTETVRRQQCEVAVSVGLRCEVLSTVLSDVDEVTDLGVVEQAFPGLTLEKLRAVTDLWQPYEEE
jgi:glycosyltransferase A (GT-A) superfamily protein (DUF2064 family)